MIQIYFSDALFSLCNSTSSKQCIYTKMDKLPEDLAAEIFVRLPPYPRCVLTISATRKNWRQFMGSNYFRKLSLSHNGGIPLLGFYTNSSEDKRFISEHSIDTDMLNKLEIIPMGMSIANIIYVIGCRNGMVLLHHLVESWASPRPW